MTSFTSKQQNNIYNCKSFKSFFFLNKSDIPSKTLISNHITNVHVIITACTCGHVELACIVYKMSEKSVWIIYQYD